MDTILRIKDWDRLFENSRSRQVAELRWVSLPNKHDGDGYTELVTGHPNGPAHYGAWVVIVQVASKCQPRGTLVRDNGESHDPASLARKTRFPAELFAEAVPRLLNPEIGWLEQFDPVSQTVISQGVTDEVTLGRHPSDARVSGGRHPSDAHLPKNGMEWNGMEGKGRSSCRTLQFDEADSATASWMLGLIREVQPGFKEPSLDAWANSIRLMRERDNRTDAEIRDLFTLANADDFWRANILSPDKLRKQWDQLDLKLRKGRHSDGQYRPPADGHGSGTF